MKHGFLKLTAFLFVLFFFFSCAEKEEVEPAAEYYINNPALTGSEHVNFDLGIKLDPPKGWDKFDTELSTKTFSYAGETGRVNINYTPTVLFFEDTTQSVLSVGRLSTNDTLGTNLINHYYRAQQNLP